MHARLVRLKGSPEGADDRRTAFEAEVVPVMREQPGFVGVVVFGDPATGAGGVVSYWDSEEAMNASGAALAGVRDRTFTEQGIELLGIEQFEVVRMERRGSPSPGNAVRLARARIDPATAAEALAQLDEGVAVVSAQPGFKAFIVGLDPSSGRYYVATGWETAADRDAAESATAEQRARIVERIGATGLEVDRFEVTLASMPAGVGGS